jgi:hypothetical protein
VDGEGQLESGLTADVILLSKPNYLADWSNEQLFRFGQSANTSAALFHIIFPNYLYLLHSYNSYMLCQVQPSSA